METCDWMYEFEPKTLNDLQGHDYQKKEIIKCINEGSFPQAILLSGPTGVGKSALGKIIVKTLICDNLKEDEYKGIKFKSPCGCCELCISVDEKRSGGKFFYFDGSTAKNSEIAGNELKNACSTMTLTKKIIFIEEIQEISKTNKFLEIVGGKDYKGKTTFVMTTMDTSKIHKAMTDRFSTRLNLKPLEAQNFMAITEKILKNKNLSSDEDMFKTIPESFFKECLPLLIEEAKGSARNFITNLRICIYQELFTKKELKDNMGFDSEEDYYYLIDLFLKKDLKAFKLLNEIKDIKAFFNITYTFLSELAVFQELKLVSDAWKEERFNRYNRKKTNTKDLLLVYSEVYKNNPIYIKKPFFISSLLSYYIIEK